MTSAMDETFRRAVAAMQARDANTAESLFKHVLQSQPKHVPALNLISILLTTLGRLDEAERYSRLALSEDATSDVAFYNHGLILKALKRPAEALEQFNRALSINSSVAETWNSRGTTLDDLKHYREAIADFDRAIEVNPSYTDAFCNRGKSLAALRLFDLALASYDRAIALQPSVAKAWLGRGNVLIELKQFDIASAAFERALSLKSDLAEAWLGRGNAFAGLKRYDDALAGYGRALALKTDLAEAHAACGNTFVELKRYEDAVKAYENALAISPEMKLIEGARLQAKLPLCDWKNLETEVAHLVSQIRNNKPASVPFSFLTVSSLPADQLQCARNFLAEELPLPAIWCGEIYRHERIRIAYLSADFHEHATMRLMAGLFEQHDTSRFEVTAISFGPHQDSNMRRRVTGAVERFVDVRHQNDDDIADLVRRFEIDIAVDLKGFTLDERHGVLARRAAPIQVNYLGYPGTMGADYIDYILADRTIITADDFPHYSERVVQLPDSYQINDRQRQIAAHTPTRAECGLPDDAIVLCCFNNSYKIMPAIFDVWMRILGANENAVLWLLEGHPAASANLRREARIRGISPERLIFAPKMKLPDHLARHRHADLVLDTLPYNAHTTASDALWAGVPVLTCLGATFAGRVAASLLKAANLADMVTHTLEDYETLAVALMRDPFRLASLKDRLDNGRMTCALFDTERTTRHIEAAYTTMWERHQRGEPPQSFAVDPIS